MTLKNISFFAGIGGFCLGFKQAGILTVAQIEIDPGCRFVLDRRFPDADRSITDVKDANKTNLPNADVFTGGFPCQDLSVAGNRAGLAGDRSGLYFEFQRAIAEVRPKWVVIENVPGLLSSNEGRDFAIVIGGLTGIIPEVPEGGWGSAGAAKGPVYSVAYRILDAQYFGVAQRRRRVFIVASLGNGSCAQVLFESESGAWDSPPGRETGEGAPRAVAFSAGNSGDSYGIGYTEEGTPPLKAGDSGTNRVPVVAYGGNNTAGPIEIATAVNAGHGSRRYDFESETFIASTRNSGGNNGRFRTEPGEHLITVTDGCLTPWDAQTKRIHSSAGIAPTLAGSDGQGGQRFPNYATPFGVRRLTPVECERLQGFPIQEKCVIMDVCLDHQNNSASVEIQSLKSPKPVGIAERTGLLSVVRYAETNLNPSDQSNSELARKTVLINCGENRVAILNQEKCFLSATFAEGRNLFPQLTRNEDFALLVAGLNSIAEQITLTGKAASPTIGVLSIVPQNGKLLARLSGSGTMQLVSDAAIGSITNKGLLKSITSSPSDIKISEPILITLFSSVLSAISGYIPPEILKSNSFRIEVNSSFGWTFPQSDSQRYRQLGNAVAVPCAEWIGRRIVAQASPQPSAGG